MSRRRVVQWSTGGVGAHAIAAIARRPDLELVGVWVHDPDKAGRDAGELAGIGPIGLTATSDASALLAPAPDCICYAASGESRPVEAVDDLCRMLAAGANVVTTSVPGLLYPAAFDPGAVARLDAACRAGGASLYVSGIEPGFAGDQLVLTLATMSNRIRSVRTQEIFGYEHYPVEFTMFEVFGFGHPVEHRCLMELPGVQTSAWGPPVRMVADELGVELDEIRETYDKRVTDRRLAVAAGTIEAGTVGAVRFETIGVVDGRDAIVIEHVNRMAPDLAPDWPTATTRRHLPDRDRRRAQPDVRTAGRDAVHVLDRGHARHDDARRQRDPVRLRRDARHRHLDDAAADPSSPRVRSRRRALGHEPTGVGSRDDGQRGQTPQHEPVTVTPMEIGVAPGESKRGEPPQDRFEGEVRLHARERGAEAEMDAVPEREMARVGPIEVEKLRIGVSPLVAVRGRETDDHLCALRNRVTAELERLRRVAERRMRDGRVVAQELFDAAGMRSGLARNSASWSG